uniref:NAD-dependent epimerase/dehydratase domain-containing protein n=1 Tax=Setaria digitata TaxID=48799 RepID=A0A915PKN6_9BILA
MEGNRNIKVLVTGATGFIGIHCVQQLLKENYTVRGTVRDLRNNFKIEPLKQLEGADERLELVEADLESDEGWLQAVTDCTYVLHVASPFPIVTDESVISIAVNGTLRVLRATAKSSVEKVIVTSSCSAAEIQCSHATVISSDRCSIPEGHADMTQIFNENNWTDLESRYVNNYVKSKTLAEKAAWDFVHKEDVKFKLTVINPSLVVGPLLHNVQGTSIDIIRRFLSNEMPAVPAIQCSLVDVRDVAQAHIRAMRESRTDGLRILLTCQPSFWFMDIANVLRNEFSSQGYNIPKFTVPYPIVWLYSFFSKEVREQVLPRFGDEVHYDNSLAKDILQMEFIDPKESIITMAYDIIERGMIPKQKNYRGPPRKAS